MEQETGGISKNFIWIYAERFSQQILSFIVTLVLARIISPEEYGLVALVTIFISIANVFVEGGFGTALIQKKSAKTEDYFSTLLVSFATSVALYVVIWFIAPTLETFFGKAGFCIVFRGMGVKLILSSFNVVQQAYISRKMKFKLSFIISSVALAVSAVISIVMACNGFGIWALVWQQTSYIVFVTIILALVLRVRPKWCFSWASMKEIFSFGSKMLFSSLIDSLYNNLRSIVIGKKYTSSDLAYYNKGDQFPNVIVASINSSIGKLLLPVMAREQEDRNAVKKYTRIAIRISSLVMSPILIGLAVCAEDIILLILTDAWIDTVPIMRIMCVMYMFYPIHTANLQAIIAMGKSTVYMILEIIKKVIGIAFLCGAVFLFNNVIAIAISGLIVSLIAIVINATPNILIIKYKAKEQLMDLIPSMISAILMGIVVMLVGNIIQHIVLRLCVRIVVGIAVYIILSYLLNRKDFIWFFDKIIHFINRRERKRVEKK